MTAAVSVWCSHTDTLINTTYYKYGEEMNIDENLVDIHKNTIEVKIIPNNMKICLQIIMPEK